MRIDPAIIMRQIDNLLIQFPELQEDEILRADCIEGETEMHEFLRIIERKRQEAASLAGALATNITELELRLGRFERRERAMRELAFRLLQAADLKRVELPECTMSITNGQPKVLITDEAMIPDILFRIKRELDKVRIKELLKSGAEVRGAALSNSEPHLTIRTR